MANANAAAAGRNNAAVQLMYTPLLLLNMLLLKQLHIPLLVLLLHHTLLLLLLNHPLLLLLLHPPLLLLHIPAAAEYTIAAAAHYAKASYHHILGYAATAAAAG